MGVQVRQGEVEPLTMVFGFCPGKLPPVDWADLCIMVSLPKALGSVN